MTDPRLGREIVPASNDARVRQVARALIDAGFGKGDSLFAPGRSAWSATTVDEVFHRYNEQLDMGGDKFMVKLRRQLDGASDDAILLVAELLTLHALPLLNFTAAGKRSRIQEVLDQMRAPVPLPAEVSAAFEQCSWSGGSGAHTMLWKWLADAVSFVRTWWTLPEAEREGALADPWSWLAVVHRIPGMPSLRDALLYQAFPGYFLPIISIKHKMAIREAFRYRLTDPPGDIDRDLFTIMLSLQQEAGRPVELYDPPYVDEWRTEVTATGEQRAWLIRPRPGGQDLVERWKQGRFVSLAAAHLDAAAPGAELPSVREAVENGYRHLDYAQRVALATEYHAFLSRMSEGDIVATIAGDQLSVGVISGEAAFDPAADGARLRRPVDWQISDPLPVETLPAPLPEEVDQQGTVVDLTRAIEPLTQLLGAQSQGPTVEPALPGPVSTETVPALLPATPDLARKLHTSREWLQEVIELLQHRQQVIFYGPPGTGKTFLAQEIAAHVAERGASQLVQFHPSYAYEDFFEGYRPQSAGAQDGVVSLALTAGPLRRIAAEARDNPGEPYVLIIDEINRANLAKVFGELYFLLEYRAKSIPLQYSPDKTFSLPRNLFFIGTMNTADRSIALLDAAIRRRFAFVELHPDDPPVRDLLANWLRANHKDGDPRAALLQALNAAIDEEDRDFKIGPSYMMRPEAETPGGLERIWRHDLLPLLEEHYYGRYSRSEIIRRFGLEAIRRSAATSGAADAARTSTERSEAADSDSSLAEADASPS
ncbi:MAG: McrB family protein [Streptosporangiaceae bacterium]